MYQRTKECVGKRKKKKEKQDKEYIERVCTTENFVVHFS